MAASADEMEFCGCDFHLNVLLCLCCLVVGYVSPVSPIHLFAFFDMSINVELFEERLSAGSSSPAFHEMVATSYDCSPNSPENILHSYYSIPLVNVDYKVTCKHASIWTRPFLSLSRM